MKKQHKILISGGGTGGHIFPAISIANALKEKNEEVEILFVGARGRIEMDKVPDAGYHIIGLPVAGFDRKNMLKNIVVLIKLIISLVKAYNIVFNFKPQIAVGVGGYASGPVLFMSRIIGVPIVIQEQNSFAGLTNKLLAKAAKKIFVAYDNMDKYFPEHKIILSGNPVRKGLIEIENKLFEAFEHFNLDKNKKTVLIIGGSLGARSINNGMLENYKLLIDNNIQVIWQCGKLYYYEILKKTQNENLNGIKIFDFIINMEYAYSVADVIVSRAGAGTISELCIVGKPVILVPSPNVAENHQEKNAMALVNKNAAVLLSDYNVQTKLAEEIISIINNDNVLKNLSENIKKLALKNSANIIANEIYKMII